MKTHATKCKTKDVNFAAGNQIPRECDCDGYHTFDELYDHRITLYIALCKHKHDLYALENPGKHKVWRSKRHSDGELCFGTGTQFVVGIGTKAGEQITYHIPIERWHETDFIDEYTEAPAPFDGHTSDDVITRLKNL
jgi:hypothetical protein